jgi:signal transduction histidine kinase
MDRSDENILSVFNGLSPQELPIGVYLIRLDGRFLVASLPVRQLLHLSDGDLPTCSLADFFTDPQQYEQLLSEARKHAGNGHPMKQMLVRFQASQGEVFAEASCKPVEDPQTREIIAYYGCLIDRTAEMTSEKHEQALNEKIVELTADIGRVLHANNNTLNMVRLALDPVMEILARELELKPDGAELTPESEAALLDRGAQQLSTAILHFLSATSDEMRKKALPGLREDFLLQLNDDLLHYRELAPILEARPSTLRTLSKRILEICAEIKPGFLPKEAVRDLNRSALMLNKAATYMPITRALVAVTMMDHSLQALRDYVTSDLRPREAWKYLPVRAVLDHAVSSLSEFAQSRRVDVQVRDHAPGLQLPLLEREVQRAFTNLLHNAIKYSWSRTQGKVPWVTVEIHASDREAAVSFANWGVAIAKDEIESGILFNLGYRGKLAKDRNRLGTGIGLTDARQTAQSHEGDITVTSHPAAYSTKDESDQEYYNQPFLTTVTITFSRNPKQTEGKTS